MSTIIANGLVIGAIYGLVALGLTLIYKKSRVLNFAYGEIGMVGAFVFYSLRVDAEQPYALAMAAGVAVAATLGGLTYLVLLRRRADPLAMLIGSLAIGAVLVFVAAEVWGAEQYFVPPPLAETDVNIVGLTFAGPRLLVLVVGVVLSVGFFLVFRLSKIGLVFRASADDAYAATLLGVDVVRLDAGTWFLGGALSGTAAIMVAPIVGFDVFFMTLLSIRGFAAALLAGLTNVGGALLAGLGIGLAEAALSRAITRPGVPEAMLLVVIVGVLLVRPRQAGRRTA